MANITLIGSGRTATALGKALLKHNTFVQVWSRNEERAALLANTLHSTATTQLSAITAGADIYLIAVKDDAIADIAGQLNIGDKIVAHTSGIQSKDILQKASANYGIFYPFVSMPKEGNTDFKDALVMIEGNDSDTILQLKSLGETISNNVRIVDEQERQSLHLAAVFANNFTNYMYVAAEKILKDRGMKFDDLRPLIAAHMANVLKLSPSALQTGPAVRYDSSTIKTHEKLLQQNKELQRLYLTMTEAIQDWHKEKE